MANKIQSISTRGGTCKGMLQHKRSIHDLGVRQENFMFIILRWHIEILFIDWLCEKAWTVTTEQNLHKSNVTNNDEELFERHLIGVDATWICM